MIWRHWLATLRKRSLTFLWQLASCYIVASCFIVLSVYGIVVPLWGWIVAMDIVAKSWLHILWQTFVIIVACKRCYISVKPIVEDFDLFVKRQFSSEPKQLEIDEISHVNRTLITNLDRASSLNVISRLRGAKRPNQFFSLVTWKDKVAYRSTDTTQLKSTQLNWTVSRYVLNINFIHVCKTQLNSTQLICALRRQF
jgi:hypothetical protein